MSAIPLKLFPAVWLVLMEVRFSRSHGKLGRAARAAIAREIDRRGIDRDAMKQAMREACK